MITCWRKLYNYVEFSPTGRLISFVFQPWSAWPSHGRISVGLVGKIKQQNIPNGVGARQMSHLNPFDYWIHRRGCQDGWFLIWGPSRIVRSSSLQMSTSDHPKCRTRTKQDKTIPKTMPYKWLQNPCKTIGMIGNLLILLVILRRTTNADRISCLNPHPWEERCH